MQATLSLVAVTGASALATGFGSNANPLLTASILNGGLTGDVFSGQQFQTGVIANQLAPQMGRRAGFMTSLMLQGQDLSMSNMLPWMMTNGQDYLGNAAPAFALGNTASVSLDTMNPYLAANAVFGAPQGRAAYAPRARNMAAYAPRQQRMAAYAPRVAAYAPRQQRMAAPVAYAPRQQVAYAPRQQFAYAPRQQFAYAPRAVAPVAAIPEPVVRDNPFAFSFNGDDFRKFIINDKVQKDYMDDFNDDLLVSMLTDDAAPGLDVWPSIVYNKIFNDVPFPDTKDLMQELMFERQGYSGWETQLLLRLLD